jgi:hypothetical protein
MRTCSHIKSNGSKCGSPALKYHTHCYFHYQWLNRRMNRYHYDLDEGWTTMTLPPLESKASILFAISEIQSSLLTGSIDAKVAKTLFYGIQLAIQLKATEEDIAAKDTPSTCLELDEELIKARFRHHRPPQPVCDTCERATACSSDSDCHYSTEQIRELERIHEPERYGRQRADEKRNEEEWRQHQERLAKQAEEEARKRAAKTAPVPHATTSNDSSRAQSQTAARDLLLPLPPRLLTRTPHPQMPKPSTHVILGRVRLYRAQPKDPLSPLHRQCPQLHPLRPLPPLPTLIPSTARDLLFPQLRH